MNLITLQTGKHTIKNSEVIIYIINRYWLQVLKTFKNIKYND